MRRLLLLAWIGAITIFVVAVAVPQSTSLTRALGVLGLAAVWSGAMVLFWRSRLLRYALLGLLVAGCFLLALPGRANRDSAQLRAAYLAALRRYEGAPYKWGGESPLGIDCSGLVRRGMIDALFLEGLRTLDGEFLRRSINLWWHDGTAREMAEGYRGFTRPVFTAPSLNALGQSQFQPGDIAVTPSGFHVLASLDEHHWIEADPGLLRVVIIQTPSNNLWTADAMTIARWRFLEP